MALGADFLPRLLSALVLAPVVLIAAYFGGWPFAALFGLAAVLTLWEWVVMTGARPKTPLLGLGGVSIATAIIAVACGTLYAAAVALILGLAAVALVAENRLWAVAGTLYAAAAGLAPLVLRSDPNAGLAAVFWLFAVVWGTDIAAYFCGRLIGGPKLWRRVSPNKTWSGALGGALFGTAAALLVVGPFGIAATPALALVSLAASAASQCGDLYESALKRRFGVKDSSALIPGHGGLMDRLDGFIAAAALAVAIGLARDPGAAALGLLVW